MPNQTCCEVFRNPCTLILCDEPFVGTVEHGPMQLWVTSAQVGIALNRVHSEVLKQPASLRYSGIQPLLKDPMQRHLSLRGLGLQQSDGVWPDADKPP